MAFVTSENDPTNQTARPLPQDRGVELANLEVERAWLLSSHLPTVLADVAALLQEALDCMASAPRDAHATPRKLDAPNHPASDGRRPIHYTLQLLSPGERGKTDSCSSEHTTSHDRTISNASSNGSSTILDGNASSLFGRLSFSAHVAETVDLEFRDPFTITRQPYQLVAHQVPIFSLLNSMNHIRTCLQILERTLRPYTRHTTKTILETLGSEIQSSCDKLAFGGATVYSCLDSERHGIELNIIVPEPLVPFGQPQSKLKVTVYRSNKGNLRNIELVSNAASAATMSILPAPATASPAVSFDVPNLIPHGSITVSSDHNTHHHHSATGEQNSTSKSNNPAPESKTTGPDAGKNQTDISTTGVALVASSSHTDPHGAFEFSADSHRRKEGLPFVAQGYCTWPQLDRYYYLIWQALHLVHEASRMLI